jgi:hypothetical protein
LRDRAVLGRQRFTLAGLIVTLRVSRLARLEHSRARLGAPAPVWLAVTPIFVAERVVTVRAHGPLQMALAAALRVEMPFDRFLRVVHAKAILDTLTNSERKW